MIRRTPRSTLFPYTTLFRSTTKLNIHHLNRTPPQPIRRLANLSILQKYLAHEVAILVGSVLFLLLKHANEVRHVIKSAAITYLCHGLIGLGEQLAGLSDAQIVEIIDESSVGLALEEMAEGRVRHADERGHIGQADVVGVVFFHVSAHFGDATALARHDRILGVVAIGDKSVAEIGRAHV